MPPMPIPPAADPAMAAGPDAGAPAAEAPAGPKYTIEIEVGQDDSLTVSVESGAQEAAEGGGMDDDTGNSQPAANIKEALTMALYAFKNGGQLPDMQGQTDAFEEGFSGAPAKPGAME